MIVFWIVAGLLVLAALAVLLRPLIRRPRPGGEEAEEPVAALYRRQIAALEDEAAQGRIDADQVETTRAEITRRLLAAAESRAAAPTEAGGAAAEASRRIGVAVAIAGLLPAAAFAVYVAVGAPTAIDRKPVADSAAPQGAAELAAAADRIKAHLRQAPGDLEGWALLGRSLASLGRFAEAHDAYTHAIALAPGDSRLHGEFGEILVMEAQGTVTAAAEAEFAKAPGDPRARYYGAEAALQHGDRAAARRKLQAMLADAPADAAWRRTVAERLAELSPETSAPGPAPPAGPTEQEVAAAQAMTPEQRQALIRGMVDRLAQRLEQHPNDKPGWERLARAYDVLGQPDKAQAARAREAAVGAPAPVSAPVPGAPPNPSATAAPSAAAAPSTPKGWLDLARTDQSVGQTEAALAALKQANQHFPGNLALLEAYMSALAAGGKGGQPTAELVDLAARVNALDPNELDALWYLGLAAAQGGDRYRAAGYWTRLLAALPPSDGQRRIVQQKLDGLR